jgi:hypothetical protein
MGMKTNWREIRESISNQTFSTFNTFNLRGDTQSHCDKPTTEGGTGTQHPRAKSAKSAESLPIEPESEDQDVIYDAEDSWESIQERAGIMEDSGLSSGAGRI